MTARAVVALALAVGGISGAAAAAARFDADLAAAVREVGERLAAIRGSTAASAPLAVRASAAERSEAAAARVRAVLGPERLAARGRAFLDVGFPDADVPEAVYRALATDLPDVVPSADGKRLLVDEARLTEADFAGRGSDDAATALLLATGIRPDEPLVAHALVHLEEAREGTDPRLRETTDGTLAAAAWREGEANLSALLLLYAGLGLESDVVQGRILPEGFRGGALVSPVRSAGSPAVRRLLEFVYLDGFAAAAARLREGGWRGLEASRNAPPRTRDVIRSRVSRRGEPSPEVPLPPPPDGYALVDRDVVGEAAIIVLVAEGTGKDNLGMLAADGWVADRLLRWERKDGEGITLWETRWASEEDAADFEYSLGRVLEARFGRRGDGGTSIGLVAGGRRHDVRREGTKVDYRIGPAPKKT